MCGTAGWCPAALAATRRSADSCTFEQEAGEAEEPAWVAGARASAEAAPRDAGRWLAYALEHVRFGDAAAITGSRALPALSLCLAAGQGRGRVQGRAVDSQGRLRVPV